ncbi:MAG TPA: hypothetical protein VLH15_06700 [Dehalococcoidales bacterium]|nr:hypothetical protein [Dehalococcoidales bacterium]
MATEDRVKILEGEFKLIKNELRQTLGSVRDFLLDLKLPPMQDEPGLTKEAGKLVDTGADMPRQPENPAPGSEKHDESGNAGFGGDGMRSNDPLVPDNAFGSQPDNSQATGTGKPLEEPSSEELPPLSFDAEDDNGLSSGDIPGLVEPKSKKIDTESEDNEESGDEDVEPVTEDKAKHDKNGESSQDLARFNVPQVNLLANIIRWVSTAKKQIGSAQLPVLLDVYSATGSLNPDIRELILHLAEVATAPELAGDVPETGQVISEQLKLCMEINRSSTQLPEETKFKIQRLLELILQQSMTYNKADIWSMLLVDLHGVLSGGGSSIRLVPAMNLLSTPQDAADDVEINDELTEPEVSDSGSDDDDVIAFEEPPKSKPSGLKGSRPVRLRLIMPAEGGREQELDLGNIIMTSSSISEGVNSIRKPVSKGKKAWL